MDDNQNKFLSKLTTIIFAVVFLVVIGLISLIFFVPKTKINTKVALINYPINLTWQAIYEKRNYLESKKEISRYAIYDSILPRWVEYYTSNDSIENVTKSYIPYRKLTYAMINIKHQQINTFSYRIESQNANQTKVTIYELSRYFNVWGSVYFQLFHPNTILDYELIKLENTLKHIADKNKKIADL